MENILFLQKLKNFKNSVALFWQLNHRSSKSHDTATSLRVGFGDLFASKRSNCEGYTEIFVAQLATPSRVRLLVAKMLRNFFQIFRLEVFWRVTLATCLNRENRVFCKNEAVFLKKKTKQNPFEFFPRSFMTIHCLLCQNLLKRHSVHQSSRKDVDFISFSMCSSYLALYLLDCGVFVILFYT